LCWVFVVAGLVAAGAWWPYATSRVYDAVEDFTRVGPYGGKVSLTSAGPHTIWIEGSCLSCHDNDPPEYRAAATVSLRDPDGQQVALHPAAARVFNTSRREGRSIWRFDAPRPGPYVLSLDLDTSGDWDNALPADLAVSRGNGLPVGIVRPMALFAGGGIAIGAAIALVISVRRRRHFARAAPV
jgi:hypothetical protein